MFDLFVASYKNQKVDNLCNEAPRMDQMVYPGLVEYEGVKDLVDELKLRELRIAHLKADLGSEPPIRLLRTEKLICVQVDRELRGESLPENKK